jgi:hypothetical protein
MGSAERKRLDALLLARATEGLDAPEEQELARLLAASPDVDATAYERAASAVCLAVLGGRTELPAAMRARLERAARDLRGPKAR